ncbi:UPF0658 Golgi apparatus membrane protein [Vanrija pseudolonga]|uniref:UPF0658 Golgi apparatus membrane protein n=1 Tax=Vanrija pseudolonga TaxID=143232 RepID=A0AAF0Y942_9TREE|nr:UPF0658 Golgi apparatus membrane protein [Vanrija pseudolonga]
MYPQPYRELSNHDFDMGDSLLSPEQGEGGARDMKHSNSFKSTFSRFSRNSKASAMSSASRTRMLTRAERAYLIIAALEALIVSAIAFAVFALVEARVTVQNAKVRTVPVYLVIFILARLFSCVYSFDALSSRNVIQLCLHIFFQVCMLTYAILEIPQTRNAFKGLDLQDGCVMRNGVMDCVGPGSLYSLLEKLMIVPPIVIGLATIAYAFLARHLYFQFGWAQFKLVNASLVLRKLHRDYQLQVSLLKLVAYFSTAFCISYLILITSAEPTSVEFIITIIALPLSLTALGVCGWALKHEKLYPMAACLILMLGGEAYFVYKLISLWMPKTAGLYKNTKITMAVFSVFSVLIFACTFVNGCICINNFGKGLKDAHEDPEKNEGLLGLGLPAIGLPATNKTVGSPIDSPYEVVSPTKLVIE